MHKTIAHIFVWIALQLENERYALITKFSSSLGWMSATNDEYATTA